MRAPRDPNAGWAFPDHAPATRLEYPDKWTPVFRKIMRMTIRPQLIAL
jgi:hypothetical protein